MQANLSYEELEAGWARLEPSPLDDGSVEMIVRRPARDQREELASATFSAEAGLAGDDWLRRSADPQAQITLMNSRLIDLLAGDRARWAEAGDQLFVDMDVSQANLPAGTRLQIGEAVMEISPLPHEGCTKFARRFGGPARKWIMSDQGVLERRRGVYATVIEDGMIRQGDRIRKLPSNA